MPIVDRTAASSVVWFRTSVRASSSTSDDAGRAVDAAADTTAGPIARPRRPNLALNLDRVTLGVNVDNLDGLAIFLLVLLLVVVLNVGLVWVSWSHTRVLQRFSSLTVAS